MCIRDSISTIDNSTIRFSTIDNSTTDNSTINYSTLRSTNDNNSTFDNSTLTLSNTCSSDIDNSTIDNSTVCNSTILSSTVSNSTIDNSTISHSTLDNATVSNSIIDNSTLSNVTVDNMTINNGSIVTGPLYAPLVNDTLSGFTSSTRPTVSVTNVLVGSNWTDANGGTNLGASRDSNIIIHFSESMDPSSITVNTSSTSCSTGTIMVSKISDNFALNKCIQMSSSPTASNNNKWFTVEHNGCLANGGSYYIRVKTGVKDGSGISMETDNTTANGFGTNKLSCP